MESPKYSRSDAFEIHPAEGSVIYEYPSQSRGLRISFIRVKGRRPAAEDEAFVEHDCTFSLYVVEGSGTVTIDSTQYSVTKDDVVTVLSGKRWVIEGDLAYVVATTPAFYPEQSETVKINRDCLF